MLLKKEKEKRNKDPFIITTSPLLLPSMQQEKKGEKRKRKEKRNKDPSIITRSSTVIALDATVKNKQASCEIMRVCVCTESWKKSPFNITITPTVIVPDAANIWKKE